MSNNGAATVAVLLISLILSVIVIGDPTDFFVEIPVIVRGAIVIVICLFITAITS